MYTPPAFLEDDPDALRALIAAARLALLACNGADGVPVLTHLPLLLEGDALVGHVARGNRHWRDLATAGRAVAVFAGPEAYVSPGWYASKAEHGRVVPTWNYVAVHAEGPVEVFDDPARLRDAVQRLTERHEAGRPAPWSVDDAPPAFLDAQLRGIVGVRLRIERLTRKRKLSQNRPEADQAGVLAGLDGSAEPRDGEVAAAMRQQRGRGAEPPVVA